jgi:ATP-binding cassette, subfamily A (ABC1), member 3
MSGRSYAQNLFVPPSRYGIGSPTPVLSLESGLSLAGGGRTTVAFVNNAYQGGEIDRVITDLSGTIKSSGREAVVLSSENELRQTCRTSISGVSGCIVAVVFHSSPTEGHPPGMWNYTLRADGALGETIDVRSTRNSPEIYLLPFQHAIDWSIAEGNSSVSRNLLPSQVSPCDSYEQRLQETHSLSIGNGILVHINHRRSTPYQNSCTLYGHCN